MWRWATASRIAPALAALGLLAPLAGGAGGEGAASLSADEVVALAFPQAELSVQTVYLTPAQRAKAAALAGSELPRGVFRVWTARRRGEIVGQAVLDTHRVRSLEQSLVVAADSRGRILRVEVVAFQEPPEYLPRRAFYQQFEGRALDRELELKRGLRSVSGATLTSRATVDCARRALALQAVLGAPGPGPSAP